MARIILTPLHYLAIAALAVPLLGLGYIMGNGDVLAKYRLNLELSLSGPGEAYDGKIADASHSILPIIAEANDLFDIRGKGPRADLLYRQRVATSTDYAERRRLAELAVAKGERVASNEIVSGSLAPKETDRKETGRKESGEKQVASNIDSVTNIYPMKQKVNRGGKANRTEVAGIELGPDPVGLRTKKVAAGLPIISQQRVAGVFNIARDDNFSAVRVGFPPNANLGREYADNEKPTNTGLEVKQVASLATGARKFFGGLTEGEFRQRENRCLATAIYFEARSEPIKGQIAVAQVIMNRVRSRYYADTVCGVVYEGAHKRNACQFSFACDGAADKPKDKKRWAIASKLAKRVTDGKVWLADIGHASHYHATYVKPSWRRQMKLVKQIGAHIFYRAKYFTRATEVAIR